ncbi:MAG: hypothetical protein ACJ71J_14670 [Nitrososphaeraceae archaeon]
MAVVTLMAFMTISLTAAAITTNAQIPGVTPQQSSTDEQSSQEQQSTGGEQANTVTIQKTAESTTDPFPGHSAHQLVMALPPRDDGKVWVGTVTWTASKQVEVFVLHGYNSTLKPDASHGSVLTAPVGQGKEVAISLVKTSSGTPINSGSMRFVGNAVAFHTLNGAKFTVTYSLDAVAKPLSQ